MPPAKKKNARKKATPVKVSHMPGKAPRWTDEQVQMLKDAVDSSPTARAAFESVAKKLGKNVGTVQQKYYNLQKTSGKRRARVLKGRRGVSSPVSRTSSANRGQSTGNGVLDVKALSSTDLANLAQAVASEVQRRQRELEKAAGLFR